MLWGRNKLDNRLSFDTLNWHFSGKNNQLLLRAINPNNFFLMKIKWWNGYATKGGVILKKIIRMSACMSEFKKMFKFATNLNHKVVSSSTMDIYDQPQQFRFDENKMMKWLRNTIPPPLTMNSKIVSWNRIWPSNWTSNLINNDDKIWPKCAM